MSYIVQKTLGGQTFFAVNPDTYPHGNNAFDEEEPIFAEWMKIAGPGKTLVDVGACFGTFTLPALAAGANVMAFEPSDDGFAILRDNVAVNGWQERADLRWTAVFDGSQYPPELHTWIFGTAYPSVRPAYSTLDAQVDDRRIDAIKIDVEGGELGVLRGGETVLRLGHPTLLIEDHSGIMPGHVVSDYPESLGGTGTLTEFLQSVGYTNIRTVGWNDNRKYVIARAT